MHSNFLEEMKIKEVIGALERFAPLPLQDGFDNAGLQIGLTEAEATGDRKSTRLNSSHTRPSRMPSSA